MLAVKKLLSTESSLCVFYTTPKFPQADEGILPSLLSFYNFNLMSAAYIYTNFILPDSILRFYACFRQF